MKALLEHVFSIVLACLYAPCKLLPTDPEKILFLSRQSNRPSLDFNLLQAEIRRQAPQVHIVMLCNRIERTPYSLLRYAKALLQSMYHLATARICVLDSYWPAVSILHHKPDLTVIQIWHAMGKIKKSGLQTVGKPGGHSLETAHALHIHENYDWVVSGAPAWNPIYRQCFGCGQDRVVNFALPRLDFLLKDGSEIAAALRKHHPELEGKPLIVYAPTFRRSTSSNRSDLVEAFDRMGYPLIIKNHPNQRIEAQGALRCPGFSTTELLRAADLLITDYSAIAIEGAAAEVPTLYYLYDYEEYCRDNGLNLSIPDEMPECVSYDLESLMASVKSALDGGYPYDDLARYRDRYAPVVQGSATARLAAFVVAQKTAATASELRSSIADDACACSPISAYGNRRCAR